MRFSYCKSLIAKKSFYIFKTEYFFEHEFNSLFLKQYGLSKLFIFFSFMMFELHNSFSHISLTFLEIGLTKSRNFAKFLLRFYQPHINIRDYFFLNLLRLLKPLSLRGKNLIAGLPMRGQRSHSNRKSMLRFRGIFSNYLSNVTFANFSHFLLRIKLSSLKNKDPIPGKIKKTNKSKSKSGGSKKPKKKKLNVWK